MRLQRLLLSTILLLLVVGFVVRLEAVPNLTGRSTVSVAYNYDAAGRLISADYGTESITYAYDNNGNRLTRTTDIGIPTQISLTETLVGTPSGLSSLLFAAATLLFLATVWLRRQQAFRNP